LTMQGAIMKNEVFWQVDGCYSLIWHDPYLKMMNSKGKHHIYPLL
jgi:hypothetical protein